MKRNPNKPKTLAALAATAEADPDVWELRLCVAGKTPRSVAAFENLTKLCEEHLPSPPWPIRKAGFRWWWG